MDRVLWDQMFGILEYLYSRWKRCYQILYLCQDFTCLITGSTFWCFCNNSWVIFSVVGRKTFSISVFDKGIVSRGSWRIKTWFIVYFDSLFRGPDKFIFSFRFYFSPEGNRSVFIWFLFDWFLLCIVLCDLCIFVIMSFGWIYFPD